MRGYRKPSARQMLKLAARIAAANGNKEAARIADVLHGGAMARARGAGRWNLMGMIRRRYYTLTRGEKRTCR